MRPVRDVDPGRSLFATWLRGRRMPAIPAMARVLADAATSRLGSRRGNFKPATPSPPALRA